MRNLVLLFSVFMLALSAYAGEFDQQPAEYWSEVLAANDFKGVLSVFQIGPKVEWPPVHSAKYADEKDKTLVTQGVEFRKFGELLAHDLEDYERQLQGIPSEQFCERCESLLAMRQQFLCHPSYFNLILADSVNRVLYVNLAERLAFAVGNGEKWRDFDGLEWRTR
ncbi:MAG TPA: hypothetical protein PKY10_11815, partial [Lentisphaeria bacterium]|nr:hypothetical protein [Lentisphaeria bacterium]